jgi:hypothetical protein
MKNYRIHFSEEEREAVLEIITRSNDVVLNQVEPLSAFITIQQEDDEADLMYAELLARIDRELHPANAEIGAGERHVQTDDGNGSIL